MGPILTDSIRFWEKGRLLYNAVLVAVVAGAAWQAWPVSRNWLRPEPALEMFVLAAAANVLYCSAYLIDVPVQLSEFRPRWLKLRGLLLLAGTALAAALAALVMRLS